MNTEPKPGQRVRVTYEAEYVRAGVFPGAHIVQHTTGRDVLVPADATIEVLAPPVETFKPGDVVRSKERGTRRYTIGLGGYIPHQGMFRGQWHEDESARFTSEGYERVDLGAEAGR